jgi:transposase InsO family protein
MPDRRAIRLADRKVVYSEGLGAIRFLLDCGYSITVYNALFVPHLAANLFAPNKFAKQHRDSMSEVTDYLQRKWVNRRTGAMEFTATICSNDLTYLDWKVAPQCETASVSIEEVQARLNHLPFPVIRRLIRDRSLDGVPDRVVDTEAHGEFCEDCVNGKLSRAPHMKPAARAERPLRRVFSDVHGLVPIRSRQGHYYWVTFINDYLRFPAVYFVMRKSDVFAAFRRYKAWAENATGQRIGIFRDDKGSEYMSTEFDRFLADAGICREHSVRDTPQQLGVAEQMNRSIAEGITTALSQSGLTRTWWEDAGVHWLYAKIRLPSSVTAPLTPFELFYSRKPSLSLARPFGCLAYVHLQKDQRPLLTSHAVQCVLIGYPADYKAWRFWNPSSCWEVISDSAVFRESVFPHRRPGLLSDVRSVDLSPPESLPIVQPVPERPIIPFHPAPDDDPSAPEALPSPAPERSSEPSAGGKPTSQLVARFHAPSPALAPASPAGDLPVERPRTPPALPVERPHTPPAVKRLTSHFEHHPSVAPLPPKRAPKARQPGVFAEANLSGLAEEVAIPLHDAVECALRTSDAIEPRTLAEALRRPDADKWVAAALAEIEAHLQNGTWVLAQLPPGKRAIGSQWVFKVKRTPEGHIDKYKGRIVAQGYLQIPGIHYNEVFASTARMAAVRTVMAIAAVEDLELESLDVSTVFLNGEVDAEIYMRIPEGLRVEGEPQPGEDPKRWVVRLLKGLYGIKQGPRIWALKLHSVLSTIGFEQIDCDHSVYIYRRGDVRIMMPIHVDDLLLASNSKSAIIT